MRHFTSPDFWSCFDALDQRIQDLARKNYELLKENPRHPSLHLKKVEPYWSVRVGIRYRALGVDIGEEILWFWIGSHADYDRLLG